MTETGDGRRRGGLDGAGQPRYVLPSELSDSLRRLEEGHNNSKILYVTPAQV